MRIDSIKNGIVIDHIAAGKAKEVYDALDLRQVRLSGCNHHELPF